MGDTKVKVVVRVRPANARETKLKGGVICRMQDTQTILTNPKDGTNKVFNFDRSFWSADSADAHFAGQEEVFADVGTGVLDNAFRGYNACIFAYGQTGSGKTHTMMGGHGGPQEKGIIPRLCDGIFERIKGNTNKNLSYKVQVSFMEIYNERVKDLLKPGAGHKLKVRNHSVMGPYVEGLSKLAVTSQQAIDVLMAEGNKVRTTASTNMNDTSSRSHAVFTLILTQALYDEPTKQTGEKVSRLSLVDLAGSERHGKTGTSGARLQEGANINKSLTTLGLVIKALADQSKSRGKQVFVPYRNSTLTWLLKDNLGGNAKTVMVATISPAADNFEESLSTLRYADSAKNIVQHAVVNEDPNAKLIRELREELELLRAQASGSIGSEADTAALSEMKNKLAETEGLLQEMTQTWEEKLKETESLLEQKQKLLDDHGASVTKGTDTALKVQSRLPHFIRISDVDIEILSLKEGLTLCGKPDADPPQDIFLAGGDVDKEHAIISFELQKDEDEGCLVEVVTLFPVHEDEPNCWVNGELVDPINGTRLTPGCDVKMGAENIFRFNHPTEAMRMRNKAGGPSERASRSGSASSLASVLNPARMQEEERRRAEEERRREEEERRREEEERSRAERAAVEAEKERLALQLAALTSKEQEAKARAAAEEELRRAQEAERHAQREAAEEERRRREAQLQQAQAKQEEANEDLRKQLAMLQEQMKMQQQQQAEELERRLAAERQAAEQAALAEAEVRRNAEAAVLAAQSEERARELEAQKQEAVLQIQREAEAARAELQRREEEMRAKEEAQRLETERRLEEAKSQVAEEQKRQEEAMAILKQTQATLREERQRIARERELREAAEQLAQEELMEKEAEQLRQQRAAQEETARQLEAAQAVLQAEQQRAAAEMSAKAAEVAAVEAERLEDQRRLQEAAAADLARKEAELARQKEAFEEEKRHREAAEKDADTARLFREVEEAQNAKDLWEAQEQARKAHKKNMSAREEWMRRMGKDPTSKEQKLKQEQAEREAEENRRRMERDIEERRRLAEESKARVMEAKRAEAAAEKQRERELAETLSRRLSAEVEPPEVEVAAVAEVAEVAEGPESDVEDLMVEAPPSKPARTDAAPAAASPPVARASAPAVVVPDHANNPFLAADTANNPFLTQASPRAPSPSDVKAFSQATSQVTSNASSAAPSRSGSQASSRAASQSILPPVEEPAPMPPQRGIPAALQEARRRSTRRPEGRAAAPPAAGPVTPTPPPRGSASAAAPVNPRRSMTVGAKPDVELQMAAAAMRMMQAQSEWNETKAQAQKQQDKAAWLMGQEVKGANSTLVSEQHGHSGARIKKLAGKVWKPSVKHDRLDG